MQTNTCFSHYLFYMSRISLVLQYARNTCFPFCWSVHESATAFLPNWDSQNGTAKIRCFGYTQHNKINKIKKIATTTSHHTRYIRTQRTCIEFCACMPPRQTSISERRDSWGYGSLLFRDKLRLIRRSSKSQEDGQKKNRR